MNNCSFIGRIGRDAITRFTQGGKAVTGWSLAVDAGFGDNKTTTWVDCNLWGDRGEKLAQYLVKGSQVGVTGELGTREHEGKTYVTLRVADVTLVGGKPEGNTSSAGTRGGAPQRERPARATDGPVDDFASDDIPFATNRSAW